VPSRPSGKALALGRARARSTAQQRTAKIGPR
jgi:hypothetical protein